MCHPVTHLDPGDPGGALLAQGWVTHHEVGHNNSQNEVDCAEPEVARVHLHSIQTFSSCC